MHPSHEPFALHNVQNLHCSIGAVALRPGGVDTMCRQTAHKSFPALKLLPMLILCGCAAPARVVVMPEYQGREPEQSTLAIAPFLAVVSNPGDVADDLGPGEPEQVYRAHMAPLLANTMKQLSSFVEVSVASNVDTTKSSSERCLAALEKKDFVAALKDSVATWIMVAPFEEATTPLRVLPVGNEWFAYSLPRDGERVSLSEQSDFVLLLELVCVGRDVDFSSMYTPPAPGLPGSGGTVSYSDVSLLHEAHFAIWDNNRGRLAAYGKATSESGVLFAMRKATWDQGIKMLAENIVEGTPYFKPPDSRSAGSWPL